MLFTPGRSRLGMNILPSPTPQPESPPLSLIRPYNITSGPDYGSDVESFQDQIGRLQLGSPEATDSDSPPPANTQKQTRKPHKGAQDVKNYFVQVLQERVCKICQ